jgi:hypothetical protein
MLKVLDTMSNDIKGTKKYIMDIVGIMFENYLHFIFFQTKGHWETW